MNSSSRASWSAPGLQWRVLIVKCQDQVVPGRKRWQTRLF